MNEFLEHALYGFAAGCGFWVAKILVDAVLAGIKRIFA
jgi:Na+-translocating ferredoxin:NAD+ oxidoreductase RnfA subunit